MTKRCIMLIGVPGAGKTTWLQTQMENVPFAIASTDNIIEEIALENGQTYDEVFTKYISVAEKMMFDDIQKYINDGWETIVVDRTNVSKKARRRIMERFRGTDFVFEAVVFPVPEREEWTRRLKSRPGKTIPQHVLESMANNLAIPSDDEGFVNVTYVKDSQYV